MNISEYKLVCFDEVNDYIAKGWQPFGSPVFWSGSVYQAVVTYQTPSLNTDDIRRIYEEHSKLDAIKNYRMMTGESLKNSKSAVEDMAAKRGWNWTTDKPTVEGHYWYREATDAGREKPSCILYFNPNLPDKCLITGTARYLDFENDLHDVEFKGPVSDE